MTPKRASGSSPWVGPAVWVSAVVVAALFLWREVESRKVPPSPISETEPVTAVSPSERVTEDASLGGDAPSGTPPSVAPRRGEAERDPGVLMPVDGARVALVVEGLGDEAQQVAWVHRLGVPVSAVVEPFGDATASVVQELARGGVEIVCQVPESPTRNEPKRDARRLRRALEAVPGAMGVSSRDGSASSASPELLGVLRDEDLYWLDRGGAAVGYEQALALGLAAAREDLALDAGAGQGLVAGRFDEALRRARSSGATIATVSIGRANLEVLASEIATAQEQGYEFVPLSFVLDRRVPVR